MTVTPADPTAAGPETVGDATDDRVLDLADLRLTLDGNAGPVEILRGIDVSVTRGETLGLIGPSGSGKSSLLMVMGGLERATGGRITCRG